MHPCDTEDAKEDSKCYIYDKKNENIGQHLLHKMDSGIHSYQ